MPTLQDQITDTLSSLRTARSQHEQVEPRVDTNDPAQVEALAILKDRVDILNDRLNVLLAQVKVNS